MNRNEEEEEKEVEEEARNPTFFHPHKWKRGERRRKIKAVVLSDLDVIRRIAFDEATPSLML